MNKESARRLMNANKNGGEELLQHNVATTSTFLLTAPSVPEKARVKDVRNAQTRTNAKNTPVPTPETLVDNLPHAENNIFPEQQEVNPGPRMRGTRLSLRQP